MDAASELIIVCSKWVEVYESLPFITPKTLREFAQAEESKLHVEIQNISKANIYSLHVYVCECARLCMCI